jgi:hypothetical protein
MILEHDMLTRSDEREVTKLGNMKNEGREKDDEGHEEFIKSPDDIQNSSLSSRDKSNNDKSFSTIIIQVH